MNSSPPPDDAEGAAPAAPRPDQDDGAAPATPPPDDVEGAAQATPRSRGHSRWWVVAGAFVFGVVVGVLTLGLLSASAPDFATTASGSSSMQPGGPGANSSRVPLAVTAEVNEACLRVINDAQDVYDVITGIGQVVSDVDLHQVDLLVRRLQPLEPRLRTDLRACQVDTSAGGQAPSTSTPATPAAPSPAEPTPGATATR